MISRYLSLTKPRMVLSNALVAAAGFLFAPTPYNWQQLGVLLAGLSLVVASACLFNNYYDREIDARMARTKNRPLAAGSVSPLGALAMGGVLLFLGVVALLFTNLLTLEVALAGFIIYVFWYTPLKHRSGYALYVGALAGATPPLAGYAAATNTLGLWGWVLFGILFVWQIPHFLAVAKYRFEEYQAAKVPLLVSAPRNERSRAQARGIFYASLVLLLCLCVLAPIAHWLQ